MEALWAIIVIALLVIIICLATHKRKLRDDAYDRQGTDTGSLGTARHGYAALHAC